MTVEQQGLYRNLLDEVVLRENGVIPDGSVARASGDAAAWERCGKPVLKWMKRVDGGWTNETALEVKAKSEQLSKSQRDKANKRWGNTAPADAAASLLADAGHMPPSPDPSPSKDPSKAKRQRNRRQPSAADPWNSEFADDFKAQYGGYPGQPLFKHVKAVVEKLGWGATRPVLREIMASTGLEYLNLPKVLAVRVQAAANGHTAKAPDQIKREAAQAAELAQREAELRSQAERDARRGM